MRNNEKRLYQIKPCRVFFVSCERNKKSTCHVVKTFSHMTSKILYLESNLT